MKKAVCHAATLLALAVTPVHAQFPAHVWSQRFGGPSADAATKVATDPSGNIFVTGHFAATANFGGSPLISAGSTDIFLARYDANGAHQWSKRFGGTAADDGFDVAADASGNVVVVGQFQSSADFGGGPLTSAGGRDIFIAYFDATGAHQWSRRFGGASDDEGYSVAFDANGFVIVGGRFRGKMSLGGPIIDTHTYFNDIFVAKYDASGNHVWSRGFGDTSTGVDDVAVTVDPAGNVVLVGAFVGPVDFGGGALTSSESDVFVAKYSPFGVHLWSKGFGSVPRDTAKDVATDASGNIAVTGWFAFHTNGGTIDFGGGPLTSAGSMDIFVVELDGSGAHLWSHRFGGTDQEQGIAIATGSAGTVTVAGLIRSRTDFGGGVLNAAGLNDAFLAKFDAAGVHQWSQRFGGTASESGNGVAVDLAGAVVVVGDFASPTNFGGGALTSAGANDVFVARFEDPHPIPVFITRFDAKVRSAAIEVGWNIRADESLKTITLYRRDEREPAPIALSSWTDPLRTFYVDSNVEAGHTYHYELILETPDGSVYRSQTSTVTMPALASALGQNHPNPFNPTTSIDYTLAEPSKVVVAIYRANGERVARLDEGLQGPGVHRVSWDGRDARGVFVSSGVYFYEVEGNPSMGVRKMVLLK